MSSTWKKVLLAGDETNNNIGSANLTIPNATDRRLIFGNASSSFAVKNSSGNLALNITHLESAIGSTVNTLYGKINTTGSLLELTFGNVARFSKTNTFEIASDKVGSAEGPTLKLTRDESDDSGAVDGDAIGNIVFRGNSQALGSGQDPAELEYAKIACIAADTDSTFVTPPGGVGLTAAQDGKLEFGVAVNATTTTALTIDGQGLDVAADLKENDFVISSDSTGNVNGPNLILKKTDTAPSSGEAGAKIIFQAEGADSNFHNYASISTIHQDVVNGNEDGQLNLNVLKSDVETTAFTIKGNDLTLGAEMTGNKFILRSTEQTDAADAPQLDLFKFDLSPADGALIGRIKFSGSTDDGDSTISTADYGSIHVSTSEVDTNNMDGEMHFNVMKGGSTTNVLTIGHDGGNAASATKTANEQKLIGAKVHSTSLEELTRRSILNYQAGFNGVLQSPTSSGASGLEDLRVANGVESIDGGTYANSVGIVAPFDGYICGGTFSAIRSDSSGTYADDGDLIFYVQTRTADGQNEEKIKVAETTGTATHPKSTVYNISNVRNSAYFVPKGTVLLPKIELSTNENGTRYRIDDLIAQFMLYTEEVIQ